MSSELEELVAKAMMTDMFAEHELPGRLADAELFGKYCRTARAAIAEVQRWRPIAEAPRIEYRRLWLWQRGRGGYEGWWNDFGPEGQDWQDDADSEPAPTHWQPRPAPPQ